VTNPFALDSAPFIILCIFFAISEAISDEILSLKENNNKKSYCEPLLSKKARRDHKTDL
jgi:hypothetical protein